MDVYLMLQTAELAAAQEKQMEVCDVCGAFLIVGDAQQRIDDHLMGKQHVGYARLKMAMEELIVSLHSKMYLKSYLYFLIYRLINGKNCIDIYKTRFTSVNTS